MFASGGGQFRKLAQLLKGKTTKIIILSVFLILLSIGVFGISYAYLSAEVVLEQTNIIESGVLKVDLEENAPISLLESYPITEEAGLSSKGYKFTLNNVGNLTTEYAIYLDDIEVTNQIPSNYLRYSLLKDGSYKTSSTSVLLSTLESSPNRVIDVGTIFPGISYNYELRIWIDLNAPNSVQGQEFKARLRIEETQGDEECFTVAGDTITGYSNSCPKDVVIPNSINGQKITTIGINAFANKNLTSVIVEEGITTIGVSAFINNKINKIILPTTLTDIGVSSFNSNLLSDDDAFIYKRNSDGSIDYTTIVSYGGANKEVIVPEGVTLIQQYAFQGNAIISVKFNEGLKEIKPYAFYQNNLTKIKFPSALTTLAGTAFNNNLLEDEYAIIYKRNSDGSEDKTTIIGYGGQNKDLIIPEGAVSIETEAFYSIKLTSVSMPSTLKRIEARAFGNNELTAIDIPSSVTNIGGGAFNNNNLSGDGAFIYQRNNDGTIDDTVLVSYAGRESLVVVPSQVKILFNSCFYESYNKTEILLPEGLEEIKDGALSPTGLSIITIPSTVTKIGFNAIHKSSLWNRKLTKIINKTGKSFDWGNIVNGTSGYNFVSGTVYNAAGNVEVVEE